MFLLNLQSIKVYILPYTPDLQEFIIYSNKTYKSMNRIFSIALTFILFLGFAGEGFSQGDVKNGELVFKGNCASCHKPDKDMTGPAMKGALTRWGGNKQKIYKWVKNPAAMKASGDAYVTTLLAKWEGKSGLMAAQNVNDKEIDDVLAYVEAYTPPVAVTPVAPSGEGVTADNNSNTGAWLLIIAFVFGIVAFSMSGVKRQLASAILAKDGQPPLPELTYWENFKVWMSRNKIFVGLIILFLIIAGAVDTWDRLASIGIYQGYKPEQPIAFNHTLHAGTNGINCVYCHNSAEKSKHAGIPSVNICMNCHKAINQGKSEQGTKDIQKIYAAIGWDPEEQKYSGKEQPIKWVKVHNLPDHVYFNHSQHVVVGKIECQECHGPVDKEYTVGQQYSKLTMGWCIDCHNKTAVKMEGNGYYDEIQARLKDHGHKELKQYLEDGTITAKELGGWECSKCHY
jgi:mono/diheme cytochrome c family protein